MGMVVTDLLHHPVTYVISTEDGNCILACCSDSCIRLLSRQGGELLGEYKGHIHGMSKLEATFSPSEAYIIGCSEDGKIYYWDVVEKRIETAFQAHDAGVTSLSIHPNVDFLVTGSTDSTIKIWQP